MKKIKQIKFKEELYDLYESNLNEDIKYFIKKVFKDKYLADVNYFQKKFLVLYKDSKIVSLIGYKELDENKSLIENYTKKPLEFSLPYITTRNKIIEIGNLSSEIKGLGQYIIFLLIEHLKNQQYEWLFLTAPQKILNIMKKFNLNFELLVEAKLEDLDIEQQINWGTYYEQKPYVIALDISYNKTKLTKPKENNYEKLPIVA